MAATEELRIYLRTIADTAGVTKTEQSLKGVQTQASAMGRSGATSLLAFGAAAGIAAMATDRLTTFLGDSVQATRDHDRVLRAITASYGQQANVWSRFAQQLSATTGFASDAILEAALSARTLSTNYGLSIEQTQELISASADLARVRGIGVAEAFERVQSAIRGEAEASEYLGLTLNDTFIANNALGGSLRTTFNTMTDQQKAQIRYNELLKQTADFSGLAADQTGNLDQSFDRAGNSAHNLQLEIGELIKPATIQGLNLLADTLDRLRPRGGGGGGETGDLIRGFFQNLPGHTFGEAAAAADRQREMARQGDLLRLQELRNRSFQTAPYGLAGTGTVPGSPDPAFAGGSFNLSPGTFAPSDARAAARTALVDQAKAAVRDLISSQDAQVELQRQSVDLAAQEASIRLGMLPVQERMAALQRDVAESAIRARMAALPATEALEDLRYQQERAQLIASNRNATAEERSAARRELRSLARAEPGVALAALDAGRGVTLAGRAVERVGLEQQLFQLTQERTLSQIRLAEESNSLLARIAEQKQQAILLTVNLSGEGFQTEVYKQLIEAADQANTPPAIPQSGVRR